MSASPSDWAEEPIESFGEILGGGTPSRATASFWGGSIPWVTPTDITALRGKYLTDTPEKITNDGLVGSAAKLVPVGTIVVTTRATLGEAAIAGVPLTTNQGFKNIVPNETTDSVFTYHLLKTLRPGMLRLASGTTFPEISKKDFSSIRVLRPKRDEQTRIAAILDTADEAIAKTEAMIAKLRHVRTGLIHDLLTYGLDENGHLRDPTAHPEQFGTSALGRIPIKWTCEELRFHTISSAYGPRFPGESYSQSGNVALLRTTDLDSQGNLALEQMPLAELQLDVFRPHFLEPSDFLISRSGTCGIGAVFPGFRMPVLPGAFLIRFRLKPTLLPEFLRLYVNSEIGAARIRDLAEGGVQKNIRGTALLAHKIPAPSPEEQAAILAIVGGIDSEIERCEQESAKLRSIKSGLMDDLLTGRVRVPESNP